MTPVLYFGILKGSVIFCGVFGAVRGCGRPGLISVRSVCGSDVRNGGVGGFVEAGFFYNLGFGASCNTPPGRRIDPGLAEKLASCVAVTCIAYSGWISNCLGSVKLRLLLVRLY